MDRPRVTIGGLIGLVAFVAVSFAALRDGSVAWDRALFSAAILTVAGATLGAVHRTGRARAFWLGFTLFGGIYLVAGEVPEVRSRLVTTRALALLDRMRPTRTVNLSYPGGDPEARAVILRPDGSTRPGATLGFDPAGRLFGTVGGTPESYYPIGQSLWVFVVGLAGGLLSRHLHRAEPPA